MGANDASCGVSCGCGVGAVANTAVTAVVGGCPSNTDVLLIFVVNWVIVVADVEAESCWVNVAATEGEHGTEDWLGEDVENTVEDGLRVWRDDVATLAKAPGDWVDEPEEDSLGTAEEEDLANLRADGKGMLVRNLGNVVCNEEKGENCEDEATPLVSACNESTNKTSDNCDLVNEDSPEDGGPWETGSQEQIHEKKLHRLAAAEARRRMFTYWCGNEPIDVSDVEDLTVESCDDWIAASELD
jgi:hypothetical protein